MPVHGEQIGWPTAEALPAYTVYLEAGVYYAFNNTTGAIDFQGADPAVVVQACLTAGGAGTVVGMREANYVALTGVAATANNQGIYGLGEGTYWDATALLTGTHAFTISGFTGCWLRHFAIETDAGGTLVNHCVFIEDGADDFQLIDLTIINSDSDGIHVEGTTIDTGRIVGCHILAADGDGILVDMDAANFAYRIHVEDNDVIGCGVFGISFASSGGNLYCVIANNMVYNSGSVGINLNACDYSTVRGNICIGNGIDGIRLDLTEHTQVVGNVSTGNTLSGIRVRNAGKNGVVGNVCSGNTEQGIYINNADHVTITGNVCLDNTLSGMRMDSQWSTITGNVCSYNGVHGISLASSAYNTVTANACRYNVAHGISVGYTNYTVVAGNYCDFNDSGRTVTYDGINILGGTNNLVLGNWLKNNDRWGIMVDANADYNKISNNYTTDNGSGSIRVNNANCDGNQIEWNTVEEGAPGNIGTNTRAYGNYDPSANAFVGDVGAVPF